MTAHGQPSLAALISLKGRSAVVTGGARGIGLAIATRLAEAGSAVVIADLDGSAASAAAEGLGRRFGIPAFGRALDACDADAVRALGEWLRSERGGCDTWVNNVGIYPFNELTDTADAEWDRVQAINVRSAFLGCREAARLMLPRGRGVILNVASTAGLRGRPRLSAYVASKHAVVGLTRSLALELGPSGIRVLAIAPTLVNTPGVAERDGAGSPMQEQYAQSLPLRRVAEADDVARVALFCASDLAGLVTGAVIPVDAGALAA